MTGRSLPDRLIAQALVCALKSRDVRRDDLAVLDRLAGEAAAAGEARTETGELLLVAARVAVSQRCAGRAALALDAAARLHHQSLHGTPPDEEPAFYWKRGAMA